VFDSDSWPSFLNLLTGYKEAIKIRFNSCVRALMRGISDSMLIRSLSANSLTFCELASMVDIIRYPNTLLWPHPYS